MVSLVGSKTIARSQSNEHSTQLIYMCCVFTYMHVDIYILGTAYLQPKSLLCDILSSQRHAALAGVCNAEHDPQLQLSHEIIAPVSLEDVLPGLGQALVSLLLLKLS